VLERDAVRVEFSFVFGLQMGSASFRDAFVYVAPFGEHITYNEHGLPEEIRTAGGETVRLTHNDNHQVTHMEQHHGGNVTASFSMNYNNDGDVESVEDEESGMVTELIHDDFGNVTSRTITNGELSLTETMEYTPCGNFVSKHTDFNGGESTFVWDTVRIGGRDVVRRGLLLSATDPNGNVITYTYCPTTDQLLSVSGTAQPGQVTTSFNVQDSFAEITRSHRNTRYRYNYDSRGRTTQARVGNVALVTNTYNDQNNQLVQQLFANGDHFEPSYDTRGRVIAEYWNNTRTVTYYYNENDRLSQLIDHTGAKDVTQRFDYDFAGRLARFYSSQLRLGRN
jgi:YD repeat-containing protein